MKSVNETAKIFNVTPLTIRRWISSGLINATKIGRTIRISESEINRISKGK